MRIKKIAQSIGVIGKILNSRSTSKTNTYSCDYINNGIEELTVGQIHSKNLFDKLSPNLYNTSIWSNVIHEDTNADTWGIKVEIGKTYTLTKQSYSSGFMGFLDTFPALGDTIDGRVTITDLTEVTFTATREYLVLIIYHADNKDVIQLEEGNSSTTYFEHQTLGNFKNNKIIVGKVDNKNKFNAYGAEITQYSTNTFTISGSNAINTKVNTSWSRVYCKVKGLIPNTYYRISALVDNPNGLKAGLYINDSGYYILNNTHYRAVVGATTNGNGILEFQFYNNHSGTTYSNVSVNYSEIQVEEGHQATTYFPHQNLNGEEIYSTSEIVIGKWLGKPLYRKVIDCGALPNNTSKNVSTGVSNIDIVTKIIGVSFNSAGFTLSLPHSDPTNLTYCVACSYRKSDNNISITTKYDRSSYTTTYVIIEYTKTTH